MTKWAKEDGHWAFFLKKEGREIEAQLSERYLLHGCGDIHEKTNNFQTGRRDYNRSKENVPLHYSKSKGDYEIYSDPTIFPSKIECNPPQCNK